MQYARDDFCLQHRRLVIHNSKNSPLLAKAGSEKRHIKKMTKITDGYASLKWLTIASWLALIGLLTLLSMACSSNGVTTPPLVDAPAGENPVLTQLPGDVETPDASESPPDRAALAAYVQALLNDGRFSELRAVMSESFVLQLHPTGVFAEGIEDSLFALRFRFVAESNAAIGVGDVAAAELVAGGASPATLFRGRQPIVDMLGSTGWGLAESGVGLLFLTEEEGELRWAGLALARVANEGAPFAPLPELDTAPPPAGLIYVTEGEWRQVEGPGQERLLAKHEGQLSLNPDATLALAAQIEAQQVELLDLTRGISETIVLEDTLILGVADATWLDGQTVVLGIAQGAGAVTQRTTGRLALLDVRSGTLTPIGPEISTYAHPAVTGGTLVVDSNEGLWLWQSPAGRFLELDGVRALETRGNLFSPVLAPGGERLAGVATGNFGRHTHGYAVLDLDAGTARLAHTFQPVPTEARPDWRMRWSTGGSWLALQPPSWDPLESGVWLVRADGTDRRGLGAGTADAVWVGDERLAYTRVVDGVSRAALLDLRGGEATWLNLPPGARPVAFVSAAN